jgi:hypothetical protein
MVVPDDYGRDPVVGEIVSASIHAIAIRRVDERVGEVVVHFPRAGFYVLPAPDGPRVAAHDPNADRPAEVSRIR